MNLVEQNACFVAFDRQPWHILDRFGMDKEQFEFFKEPKEHFLPQTVL